MHLKISSPIAVLFDHDIQKVTLPSGVGDITVLSWHQPLSTTLNPGLVTITTAADLDESYTQVNDQVLISVSKGLVMVDGESIVITTSVWITSASESQEVLQKMKDDLQAELDQIKAEWNKQELEAAIMNIEKVTADLRLAKFGKVS